MADGATDPKNVAETKLEVTSTRPTDADTDMTDVAAEVKSASEGADTTKKEKATEDSKGAAADSNDTESSSKTENKPAEDVTNGDNAATANGTAKEKKRKSVGGAPDHKGKKLNRKKSTIDLHLNCKPGEYWWARTKGNPAWPSIICDEDMLPDTLLSKRPVSAARADGTIRDDFAEGGKNAKDRRYAIMFLGTNEFAWQGNTDLKPLELSEVQELLDKGPTAKTSKKLWEAYEVCMEKHDLGYFKTMLNSHYEAAREEERKYVEAEAKKKEAEEAAKAAKAAKAAAKAAEPKTPAKAKKEKGKRKSTTAPDDDLEMPDVDEEEGEGKKGKASNKKKRKAPDTEGEEKPAKTPKTTLKLKAPKEPQEESAKKAPKTKVKKPAKGSDEESNKTEDKPPLSEEELKEKTRKTVLYLRHRLQKGFLARDSEPKEEEMADMAEHFKSLEEYQNLEPEIIKITKIHKVLKAIIKLNSIPKDEEYGFKRRSHELLGHWNKALAADTGVSGADGEEAKTNGIGHDEEAEKKEEDTKEGSEESKTPALKDDAPTKDEAASNESKPADLPKEQQTEEAVEPAAA